MPLWIDGFPLKTNQLEARARLGYIRFEPWHTKSPMHTVIPHRSYRVGTADKVHHSAVFPPWVPSDNSDRVHLLIVILHTAGAIGAYLMSTICDVLPANQQAMIPARIDSTPSNTKVLLSTGITEAQAFRAAFPLAQDSPLTAYVWNPYILVASFEWITAAFAMCVLRRWIAPIRDLVLGWIVLGGVAVIGWYMRHYVFSDPADDAKLAIAMGIILFFSYVAAGVLCSMYLDKMNALDPSNTAPPTHEEQPPSVVPDDTTVPDATWQASIHTPRPGGGGAPNNKVVIQGRVW